MDYDPHKERVFFTEPERELLRGPGGPGPESVAISALSWLQAVVGVLIDGNERRLDYYQAAYMDGNLHPEDVSNYQALGKRTDALTALAMDLAATRTCAEIGMLEAMFAESPDDSQNDAA